jgi:predicted RNA-binding Zn-ribbon protein involved in translation (DUF1610 family)
MAHECPICYMNCHCGGDIDDMCLSDTKEEMFCTHCNEDDDEDDEDHICPKCGEYGNGHDDNCPLRNPLYQ